MLRVGTLHPDWGHQDGRGPCSYLALLLQGTPFEKVTAHSLYRNVDPPIWYDTDVKLFEIQRV